MDDSALDKSVNQNSDSADANLLPTDADVSTSGQNSSEFFNRDRENLALEFDDASNCSTNVTDDAKDQDNQNRKVEKVLKMRFRRGMKQYLIHWYETDTSKDSWHFLDKPYEGFYEQVQKFEEERKKLNLKGIGQSSDTLESASKSAKQGKRTKHSWYYLSSSEDEDCMLKDNFWKNLDEGKLNISSDLYSGVKEAGRGVKSTNHNVSGSLSNNRLTGEVSAVIPEEFLAETKRLTRSRVQPKKTKSTRVSKSETAIDNADNSSITNHQHDSDDDNHEDTKPKIKDTTPKKRGRKPSVKKSGVKKIQPKKTDASQSKLDVDNKEADDNSMVVDNDDDASDDNDVEDDITAMLVPPNKDGAIVDGDNVINVVTDNKNSDVIILPATVSTITTTTATTVVTIVTATNEKGDGKGRYSGEVSKHLDNTLDTVARESLMWYEEHFGSDASSSSEDDSSDKDDGDGKNDASRATNDDKENSKKDETGVGNETNVGDGLKMGRKRGPKKRKQPAGGWTSFLESGPKKLKTKLEKFRESCTDDDDDDEDEDVHHDDDDDNDDGGSVHKNENKAIKECTSKESDVTVDQITNLNSETIAIDNSEVNKTSTTTMKSSLSATTLSVTSSSSSTCTLASSVSDTKVTTSEIPDDVKIENKSNGVIVTDANDTGDNLTSEDLLPTKPMDDEAKLSLARKVSLAIMKKSQIPQTVAVEGDDDLDGGSKMAARSESLGNSDSKLDKSNGNKTEVPKSIFNMKLLGEAEVQEKIKQVRDKTFEPSGDSMQDDLVNAVEANDIAKVKFILTILGQFKEDEEIGSSLVWSAVRNGYNTMLTILAMNGANVEKKNKDGLTPLLYAAEKGLHTTVHILIQLGADMSATTADGADVMVKAIKGNHKRVVHLLLGGGYNLGSPLSLSQGRDSLVSLPQYCKQVNSNDAAEVFHIFKMRFNTELIQKASQCFEGSLKIDLPVFPIQCLRVIDSESFTINFKHELQSTKKQKGMLLFVGHGRVAPQEVTCQLKGKSLIAKASVNENTLVSISDDPNFIFTFTPLVDGLNKLQLQLMPLSKHNYQTCLVVCAYSITLSI